MDKTEEWRNDEVLTALETFRADQNGMTEQVFIKALMEAVFVAPVNFTIPPIIKADGELEMADDSEMRLVTFETDEGQSVFPIFTDMEAFSANELESAEDLYSWPMTIGDYLPIFENDNSATLAGLALNPFTDGMPISRDNLAYMASLRGETAAEGGEDAEMHISDVDDADLPTPLLSELMGIADDHRDLVSKFYILWLENMETKAANYLMVVDGDDTEKMEADVFPLFAQAFHDKADSGKENVDMIAAAHFDVDMSEFTAKYTRDL